MDIRLPDGRIVRGIPDGMTKAQIAQKLAANGIQLPDEGPQIPDAEFDAFKKETGFTGTKEDAVKLAGSFFTDKGSVAGRTAMAPIGIAETAAHLGTGLPATLMGGLGFLSTLGARKLSRWTGGEPAGNDVDAAKAVQEGAQESLTYKPRSQAGQALSWGAGKVLQVPVLAGEKVGGAMADVGLPVMGAAANTLVQAAPIALGMRGAKAGVKAAQEAPKPAVKPSVSKEALKKEATEAYSRAEASDALIGGDRFLGALDEFSKAQAPSANVAAANAKLTPQTSSILEAMKKHEGDLSVAELKAYRELANKAMRSATNNPADMAAAKSLKSALDDFAAKLSEPDFVSGNAKQAIADLNRGNELYTRYKKTDSIDKLIERAKINASSPNGPTLERALNSEFKRIAMNEKKLKTYTPEEQAAIKEVVAGGKAERALVKLGKTQIPFAHTKIPVVSGISNYLAGKAAMKSAQGLREKVKGESIPPRPSPPPAPLKPGIAGLLEAPKMFTTPEGRTGTAQQFSEFGITPGTNAAAVAQQFRDIANRPAISGLLEAPGARPAQRPVLYADETGRVGRFGELDDYLKELGLNETRGTKTSVRENNASLESSASAEAIARLSAEKAAGQDRFRFHQDDTIEPLNTVDSADIGARKGQIVVQKGVGANEWTILDRGGLSDTQAKGMLNRFIAKMKENKE